MSAAAFNAPSWLGRFAANGGWIFPHANGFRAIIRYEEFTPEQSRVALDMVNGISADATTRRQLADSIRQITPAELDELQEAQS